MIHLSEEYRDCILSHQVVAPVSNRTGIKNIHGHEFLVLYLRVKRILRRIALRRIQVLWIQWGNSRKWISYIWVWNFSSFWEFPPKPNQWPVFKGKYASRLVMFEEPSKGFKHICCPHTQTRRPLANYWSLNFEFSKSGVTYGTETDFKRRIIINWPSGILPRAEAKILILIWSLFTLAKGTRKYCGANRCDLHEKNAGMERVHFNTHAMKRPDLCETINLFLFYMLNWSPIPTKCNVSLTDMMRCRCQDSFFPTIPLDHSQSTFKSSRVKNRQARNYIFLHMKVS